MNSTFFPKAILCVAYMFFSIFGLTFIKMAGKSDIGGIEIMGLHINAKLIIGLTSYVMSFLLYFFVVSKTQISLVLPIIGAINSVAILIIGVMVFKEVVNRGQLAGVGVVIIGTFIIAVFSK